MVRPAFSSLLVVALVGACAEPQPSSTIGALPGAQTERFPNGDVYVGQMAGGLRAGQFIICGSLTPPMFLDAGERGVDFELPPIGSVSVRFSN